MTVHRPDRIRQWIADATRRLHEILAVYDREYASAPWPARRGEPTALAAGTHSDPTGQTAVAHREWLEQRAADIGDVAAQIADIHARIGAAPPPEQPTPRRCTEPGCEGIHYAQGRCQAHYRRARREAGRQAAPDQR